MNIQTINVLIASNDVSMINKITDILSNRKYIKIIATAYDSYQALKLTVELKPNIVLMDISVSNNFGFDAIKEIMSTHAAPILVWGESLDKKTIEDMLSKGALEVIKTSEIDIKNVNFLNNRVIQLSKVKVITHIHKHQESASEASVIYKNSPLLFNRIIAIASSTGGPLALSAIVKHLPPDFTTPIVIAQHITNGYIDPLIKYLHDYTKMKIKEGTDGDSISPNTIYISPSNKHMEITSFGKIKLIEIIESDIYHPSCDKLLTSTARAFGKIVIGVILTGMGQDGVQGMKDIKEAGGITIAQDEESSIIFGMANIAIKKGCIDKILPLDIIGNEIINLISKG
ncbi:MAG: chemotaxis protein CheB [Nitrospirae bacterium]|nr:chemotaxis protein CheB [Nitrospirota bacterium]